MIDLGPDGEEAVRVVVMDGTGGVRWGGADSGDVDSRHVNEVSLRQLTQPVIAMLSGVCSPDARALVDACDLVVCADDVSFETADGLVDAQTALRQGWVSLCVPLGELQAQTDQLARELASKDPLALRFTKETLKRVPTIAWDAVLDFTSAQQAHIKALQAGQPSARATAIASFLAGKSKPGAGA